MDGKQAKARDIAMIRSQWLVMLCAVLLGFGCGWSTLWYAWCRTEEDALTQGIALSRIASEAVQMRLTDKELAKRILAIDPHAIYGSSYPEHPYEVYMMRPLSRTLGMGTQWTFNYRLDADGRCSVAWLEPRPVDYL